MTDTPETRLAIKALRVGRIAPVTDHEWHPNAWGPPAEPVVCQSGWHAWSDVLALLAHLNAELWLCELEGPFVEDSDQVVGTRARLVRQLPWNERIARGFAADCAEHVLHIFEAEYPNDMRPRKAIQAARDYANNDEARDAARRAARSAAAGATAAWAAACAAAWSADERPGWAAAKAVVGDAGRAAGFAAAAARSAVWDAARDAARAAECRWQATRLADLLGVPEMGPTKGPSDDCHRTRHHH